MTWDEFFMNIAGVYATKSKDPSTKVGAVIVGPDREQRAGGFNGFCRGVVDDPKRFPERHARPEKYSWFEHAERNAIYNAARVGTPTKGCTLYIKGGPPCADCARGVIQSGIIEVVCQSFYAEPGLCSCPKAPGAHETKVCDPSAIDWRSAVALGFKMLGEAKVAVRLARSE
jgi:dCMP deaminase